MSGKLFNGSIATCGYFCVRKWYPLPNKHHMLILPLGWVGFHRMCLCSILCKSCTSSSLSSVNGTPLLPFNFMTSSKCILSCHTCLSTYTCVYNLLSLFSTVYHRIRQPVQMTPVVLLLGVWPCRISPIQTVMQVLFRQTCCMCAVTMSYVENII